MRLKNEEGALLRERPGPLMRLARLAFLVAGTVAAFVLVLSAVALFTAR